MRILAVSLALLAFTACNSAEQKVETPKTEAKAAVNYFQVDPATAGSITGKITFTGHAPPRKVINVKSEEPECASSSPTLAEGLIVAPDGSLANAFVYISAGLEGKIFAPPDGPARFDQKGCMFHAHVIGVRTGQKFIVSNSDPVTHNVHPIPQKNVEWNRGQRPGAPPLERVFDKPEIGILVKCNVHSWMNAYVNVVDHPYFAVTGEDGSYTLKNLPPGDYTVTVWHEKLGTTEQKVTVPPSGAARADFKLGK